MKKLAAEFVGTFALVFVGTGSIIVNDLSGGVITHPGVSLSFGLIVGAMILAFGSVSGAHFNPAVSLGFFVAGRFPLKEMPPYVLSQLAGATFASLSLRILFPDHQSLGVTQPSGSIVGAFMVELVLTTLLMFVILRVSTRASEKGMNAAVAIGGVVAFAALLGGPISGASLNPARSLGPALVSGKLEHLWIYFAAPFLGAAIALPLCRWLHPVGCCDRLPNSTCS